MPTEAPLRQNCLNWYQDVPGLHPPAPAFLPSCCCLQPAGLHLQEGSPAARAQEEEGRRDQEGQPIYVAPAVCPASADKALGLPSPTSCGPVRSGIILFSHLQATDIFPEPSTGQTPRLGAGDAQRTRQTQQTDCPSPGSSRITDRKRLIPRQLAW